MDKEQFADWLDNDTTKFFFKYLTDFSKAEAQQVADTIVTGGHISDEEQIRIAMQCMTLVDMTEIEFEAIEDFYRRRKC